MIRAISIGILVGAIPLAGLIGYQWAQSSASQTEGDQKINWMQQQKPVPVKFVVAVPPGTPENQTVYVCGSAPTLGNWQEDNGIALTRNPDGKYTGEVELLSGIEHTYKITRGTWSTVEIDKNDKEIPNRVVAVKDDKTTVSAEVLAWRDAGKSVPGRMTLTGEVRQHVKFHSDLLKNDRTLRVYVPPGYDDPANAEKRYPVLYMQDGQNLFDEKSSFQGIEWKLDEAAQQLISAGKIEPVIIVGIYNSEQRNEEFLPAALSDGKVTGRAGDYAKFVVEQVKPFVDSVYRTQTDPANTAVGGSSLGGLASLAIVQQYPAVFGKVAVLTPYLRYGDKTALSAMGDLSFLKDKKIWIDMGGKPGPNYPGTDPLADARAFVAQLKSVGVSTDRLNYTEFPEGEHNESAWQTRADKVLGYLYGK